MKNFNLRQRLKTANRLFVLDVPVLGEVTLEDIKDRLLKPAIMAWQHEVNTADDHSFFDKILKHGYQKRLKQAWSCLEAANFITDAAVGHIITAEEMPMVTMANTMIFDVLRVTYPGAEGEEYARTGLVTALPIDPQP